jgi:hypothetical protein
VNFLLMNFSICIQYQNYSRLYIKIRNLSE